MNAPKVLDELTRRIYDALPEGVDQLQGDARKNIRAALEMALARMDLVTREEFDVQMAVLARSREKLEALEEKVAELEQTRLEPAGREPRRREPPEGAGSERRRRKKTKATGQKSEQQRTRGGR